MAKKAPLPPCDLVMKGGITSGIVYPPAVLALKEKYTFRKIGGTSAGAIAAVGTAAAEYNRDGGGFERLEKVKEWLSKDSNLLNLFQATPETQPLLDMLLAMLEPVENASSAMAANRSQAKEGKPFPLLLRLIAALIPGTPPKILATANRLIHIWSRSYKPFRAGGQQGMRWGVISGLVIAAILALVVLSIVFAITPTEGIHNLWIPLVAFLLFAIVFSAVNGWLGMWIGRLIRVLLDLDDLVRRRLSNNCYGVCTGHTAAPQPAALQPPNLTDWLSDVIDEMAGLKRSTVPLTFGQLGNKQIELKMLTSNLSHGQPYLLPHNLENFIFNASEMARFFPDYVVRHLCDYAPSAANQSPTVEKPRVVSPEQLPEGYYFFPAPDNVPVIVGARLSLSFPLLLSALPLYTVSTDAALQVSRQNHEQVKLSERDLQKNWFSDGGICSNFPIQFFDAWLPTCPTFGINLTSVRNIANTSALEAITRKRSARAESIDESNEAVYLPQAEDYPEVEWQHLDTLQAFLSAIFGTAQNYRDTMQTNLPSYRERVVQIRLDATEGGLNLTMPESVIKKIVEKGQKAGEILGSDEFDFAHHWWVRFLVLAAQLEENAEALQRVLGEESIPHFTDRLKEQWCSNDGHYPIYPYYRDEDWCKQAKARVAALQHWIENWQEAGMKPDGSPSIFFRHDAPVPNPVLRVTPEV